MQYKNSLQLKFAGKENNTENVIAHRKSLLIDIIISK